MTDHDVSPRLFPGIAHLINSNHSKPIIHRSGLKNSSLLFMRLHTSLVVLEVVVLVQRGQ